MPKEFELKKEVEVEATPEELWAAITTGSGLASWLFGDFEIEGREGGIVRLTIDDWVQESTITGWDPPRRYTVRGATSEDGSFQAFEYIVEARGDGRAVLRFVHSGFVSDDWGSEYVDNLNHGWDNYFRTLATYLKYFPGRTATYVLVQGPTVEDINSAWAVTTAGLGLSDGYAEGDQVRLTPAGIQPIDGMIDIVGPVFLGVRTDDALLRFYGFNVSIGHHIFIPNLDKEAARQEWRTWLHGLFEARA
jgi:uncharacterized protein YndB with AHSA1/START domain